MTCPTKGRLPARVHVPVPLIRRFSGDGLAVPELRSERDREILARVLSVAPPLGSIDGWHARFGRELNATDDRPHFGRRGIPVLEGKLIDPFRVRIDEASVFVDAAVARRLLGRRARIDRPRLGYREVAAATNRLTLIAAVIPPHAVTTHTIFCMRAPGAPSDEDLHWFLCGVFNSFVANYLVRLRGGTHVPAAVIHQLPVPAPPRHSAAFRAIARLARELSQRDASLATPVGAAGARRARLLDRRATAWRTCSTRFPLVPGARASGGAGCVFAPWRMRYSSRDPMANYGFAIDLRKCIGCHACTIACKAEHEIPVGVNRCWVKTVEKGIVPRHAPLLLPGPLQPVRRRALRARSARPARSSSAATASSICNGDSCIGCRACMEACPYDQLFIDPNTHTAEKCNFCANRVENKLLPACVIVCPTECRIFGDLDDPSSEVAQIVQHEAFMVRKPEKGTGPKIFYLGAEESVIRPEAAARPLYYKEGQVHLRPIGAPVRGSRVAGRRRASTTTSRTASRGASTWCSTCS